MTGRDVDAVLASIDGALGDDLSEDAMRWTAEPATTRVGGQDLGDAVRHAMASMRFDPPQPVRPPRAAWPATAHPAYAGLAVPDHLHAVRIAAAPVVFTWEEEPQHVPDQRVLLRRKAWAAAPYVGRPFVYTWPVWADEQGRWIAGPTSIQHLPAATT